jgi:chromosome segregation ATPase
MEETKFFDIDEELSRFTALEKEVNDTLKMLNDIIDMFTAKTEIAKGSAGKLVLLVEQKISLLTRKESIIKNMADLKKNMFNTNSKIKNAEDSDTDLTRVLMEYTEAIKKQQREIQEAKETAMQLIENQKEVENFFNN